MVKLHQWFRPFRHQLPAWDALFKYKYKRLMLVWPRRAGKDVWSMSACAEYVARSEKPGAIAYVFPEKGQAKRAIWDAYTIDGHPMLSVFPDYDRPGQPGSFVARKDNADLSLYFKNGSSFHLLGASKTDRLVGTNYNFVVLSEYALHEQDLLPRLAPILARNNGTLIINSTVRGLNHYHALYGRCLNDPAWWVDFRTIHEVYDEADKPLSYVVKEARQMGMSETFIQEEYYNDWYSSNQGAFYQLELEDMRVQGRIKPTPYNPQFPVHTAWDLGNADLTVIWFFQLIDGNVHVIDYFEDRQKGSQFYYKLIHSKPYAYGAHLFPFDGNQRNWETGGNKLATLRNLGMQCDVLKKDSFSGGVEAVRRVLPICFFDEAKCFKGIEHLRRYSRKQTNEVDYNGMPIYSKEAIHDIHSHAADAFRYLAVGVPRAKAKQKSFMARGGDEPSGPKIIQPRYSF